jgi:hypothetical protein
MSKKQRPINCGKDKQILFEEANNTHFQNLGHVSLFKLIHCFNANYFFFDEFNANY